MEGVGARLGRSSTRYGPATVFNGPVKKWKKSWVPLPSSSNAAAAAAVNGNSNGTNNSNLLLYKWIPISSPAYTATIDADPETPPPRRKFRYVPIYVIEEQKQEADVKPDDEIKPSEADLSPHSAPIDGSDEKPNVNDIVMEEAEASEEDGARVDEVSESSLDLNLRLKARDGSSGGDPKPVEQGDDVELRPVANPEAIRKTRRKSASPDLEMRV